MLIYLDNCCYNRPYDLQLSEIIKLEIEATLAIQYAILTKQIRREPFDDTEWQQTL